jgi:hypothetical protein
MSLEYELSSELLQISTKQVRFRAKRGKPRIFLRLLPENGSNPGRKLALTVYMCQVRSNAVPSFSEPLI